MAPQGVGPEGADEARPDAVAGEAGGVDAAGAEGTGVDAAGAEGTGVGFMARVGRPSGQGAQAGQTSVMLHLAMPNSVSTSSG